MYLTPSFYHTVSRHALLPHPVAARRALNLFILAWEEEMIPLMDHSSHVGPRAAASINAMLLGTILESDTNTELWGENPIEGNRCRVFTFAGNAPSGRPQKIHWMALVCSTYLPAALKNRPEH